MPRIARFAGFELDEEKRSLRHGGRELVLQPRVFDLLAYLVAHRDRVISTDELVEEVWEGAFVADGAVQRAVSLARAALRDGAPEAIRTYPRQGYRFCTEVECDERDGGETTEAGAESDSEALGTARGAFAREAWQTAAEAYRDSDQAVGLAAADLERWGQALEYQGLPHDAVIPLERAVAGHAAAGDRRSAARCALRLANILVEQRESIVGAGWFRRAARYLESLPECREHGLLDWMAARLALFGKRLREALDHAQRTLDMGRRLEDGDLEAMGLLYTGLATTALGEPERGMSRIDEAATMVLAGEVGPWEGGLVFCGVIWACLNQGDWRRAAEWSDQFTRWCAANGTAGYPGLCRLHRAEVLSLQGELDEAEREVEEARQAIAVAIPMMEGDAFRLLGEIRLTRGDLAGAEKAFRRAHELSWDPNPGLALLQAARGQAETAQRSLERVLDDPDWISGQKRGLLLGHLAAVAAAAGDRDRAHRALEELDEHPDLWQTAGAAAHVCRARGELALVEGRTSEAVSALRESVRRWSEIPSPCHAAAVRLRLAEALAADGDAPAAELELTSAEAAFTGACAEPLVAECRKLRRALTGRLAKDD